MGIQLSDLVEDIVGKEEIARDEQFLLLPQCFQKQCLFFMHQNDNLWSKGLTCSKVQVFRGQMFLKCLVYSMKGQKTLWESR